MPKKKNWIMLKRGLSEDPKHRANMGNRIWLFLHIIDRADWETGTVYDWKDKGEASDMGMEWRGLQKQRQELAKLGYITCKQKGNGQQITIHEWVNPKNYSGEVLNSLKIEDTPKSVPTPTEGTPEGTPPSNRDQRTPSIEIMNQGSGLTTMVPGTPEPNNLDPIEPPQPPKTEKSRPRDLLFDAIAEVCHIDPATAGASIAKVAKALRSAKPPYTPDEVKKYKKIWWEWDKRTMPPTLWKLQEQIGIVRNPQIRKEANDTSSSPQPQPPHRPDAGLGDGPQSDADRERDRAIRERRRQAAG